MARINNEGLFKAEDLVEVPQGTIVIHMAGGPLLEVVTTEGDMVLVKWWDGSLIEGKFVGETKQQLVDYRHLRRMIYFHPSEIPFSTSDPFNKCYDPDNKFYKGG